MPDEAARIAKRIESIVAGTGTKADRARALFDLGCDRSDVVELLDMSYSQAHSIWKKRHAYSPDAEAAAPGVREQDGPHQGGGASTPSGQLRAQRGRVSRAGRTASPFDALPVQPGKSVARGTLYLSPSQTRYATQDGHVIVRVDTNGGPECRNCSRKLAFSIKWLSFVHADSSEDPTELEDIYVS